MKCKPFIKKGLLLLALCFIPAQGMTGSGMSISDEGYGRYTDETFHFTILIPSHWQKKSADLSYKHILTLTRGQSHIRITAVIKDKTEVRKWQSIRDWYFHGIGKNLKSIIETREVVIHEKTRGRLYVMEFTTRKRTMLQRTLIAHRDNAIVVIECVATVKDFHRHRTLFNDVMGSLIFDGDDKVLKKG